MTIDTALSHRRDRPGAGTVARHRPLRRAVARGRRPHRPRAGADLLRRARPRGPRDRRRARRARGSSAATTSRSSPARAPSGRSPTSARCAPGATVVPIYHTNSPEECEYMLAHAGVRAVFCEDAAQVAKVAQVRDALPGARARHRVRRRRAGRADARRAARARRRDGRRRASPSALARVEPARRGHDRLHVGHDRAAEGLRAHPRQPARHRRRCTSRELELQDSRMVIYLFLPLAHSLARVAQYAALEAGGTLAFWGGDPRAHRRRSSPRSARRTSRRCRASTRRSTRPCSTASPSRAASSAALFDWALREGARARAADREGRPLARPLARRATALADRLVLSKVRGLFGDRLAMALCGAAPIAPRGARVLRRLRRARARGLRHDRDLRRGDAQHAARGALRHASGGRSPGREVAIAEDGEILLARPARVRGLPPRPRGDRGRDGRPLAALGRPRRDRRRRLPAHHRAARRT